MTVAAVAVGLLLAVLAGAALAIWSASWGVGWMLREVMP